MTVLADRAEPAAAATLVPAPSRPPGDDGLAGLQGLHGLFGGAFAGRRVLLTGHTGFKGSWLALWLQAMGAQVQGLALAPATRPNHWDLLGLGLPEHRLDIRDAAAVRAAVAAARPELVLHLAAQPLVRRSYADPLETWSTNVMGTAHLLEACRHAPGVRAVLVVTTDKCYDNQEWHWGYRERDPLGGHDPYSASKAATELAVASWRSAFGGAPGAPLLATARAGNVVGGGDWSDDRLVPDLVRALAAGQPLRVRAPQATRPWQHVLESLSGYLLLARRLLDGDAACARAFNFGPGSEGNRTVADVLQGLQAVWPALRWQADKASGPHEATLLQLDSSLARAALGWQPVWGFDETLRRTASWYRVHQASVASAPGVAAATARAASTDQLHAYAAAARQAGLAWATTA